MSRRLLTGLGVLAALPLLGAAGVELAWSVAAQQAQQQGVHVAHREGHPLAHHWSGIQRGALHVADLHWELGRPHQLVLAGAEVRLDSGGQAPGEGGGLLRVQELPALPPWIQVHVQDLRLVVDGEVIGEPLTGIWTPSGGRLEATDGTQVLTPGPEGEDLVAVTGLEIPLEALSGWLQVSAQQRGDVLTAQLHGQELVARHPVLSKRALELPALDASLVGSLSERSAHGSWSLGSLQGSVELACSPACTALVTVPSQPAEQVLSVVAPLAPELRTARVLGDLGGTLTVDAEGNWVLTPDIGKLQVEGAVPDLGSLRQGRFRYRVRRADGGAQIRTSGEGTPDWVPLRKVSPNLQAAVVAAEDSAFYRHEGIDPEGIAVAISDNQAAGGIVRGGSTLTQQLAKNLYLDGERTLERKLREALLALELDRSLGKERVLELYVNVVEWGPDLWGIGPASERYFLRQADKLPPHESAFLAALLPSPRRYYQSWYVGGRERNGAIARILENMADGGFFSKAEAAKWSRETLRPIPPPE